MSYVFSKTLALRFADAVARTREALAAEGFGVIAAFFLETVLG